MSQGQRRSTAKPGSPVFLEPQGYRRRRLMDGARVLPAFGVLLWMVPLLWPTGSSDVDNPVSMSSAMLYIFAVWGGLICITVGIWIKTRADPPEDADGRSENPEHSNGPD